MKAKLIVLGLVAFLGCHTSAPLPSEYPEGGIVEVFADDSVEAAASPCGQACSNIQRFPECLEDFSKGVSCYRACTKQASLVKVPVACWAKAQTVDALRRCGDIRCVP